MSARVLVLDAYGVLYRPGDDVAGALIPFVAAQGSKADRNRVQTLYREASLGHMTARTFWTALGIDPAREADYLATIGTVPGVLDFLREAARAFGALACLSNDVAAWSRALRTRHGLDAAIPTWVVSGEVGLRKPAPEIYSLLLRRLAVPPETVWFVDDRPANLDAARRAGLRTVLLSPEGAASDHVTIRALPELLGLRDP